MERKNRVAFIFGSSSDLDQTVEGFELFIQALGQGRVEDLGTWIRSVHRHTLGLVFLLFRLVKLDVTVIVTGAGKSNGLSGVVEAIMYRIIRPLVPALHTFGLLDRAITQEHILRIRIIGVAFKGDSETSTEAARLSTSEVPGSQLQCTNAIGVIYLGAGGFQDAVADAINDRLPKELKAPKETPMEEWPETVSALAVARAKRQEKLEKETATSA